MRLLDRSRELQDVAKVAKTGQKKDSDESGRSSEVRTRPSLSSHQTGI